jgi:alpha-amylase/alpha-mannosidase (GH57 family)
MEKFICIHGHFYQPPRENPWLEAVELQDSAAPYHDWNERITAQCYAPNAHARLVDGAGRIERIVSNYSKISFNFGPSLLSWMKEKAPDIHRAIVEADKESRKHFSGHGTALAQCYNHLIMPLANRRDKYTQVVWGISDFDYRFGRKPEGMWLPETAVDDESLDILAEQGIKFTILSPFQASRVKPLDAQEWQDVNGGRVDPSIPYLVKLPAGRSIAVFFYDAGLAKAVAFERLLTNGETFAHRMMGAFDDGRGRDQLVNVATDGESYGHHFTYGDMALAYALRLIESEGKARLTIYAEYLEKHPPTHEAQVHQGSAWSCSHGVDRWRRDCGCNTGGHPGWNQRWREPLRNALDWLRDKLAACYEAKSREFLRDPWAARDAYITIILDRSPENIDRFFGQHATRTLNEEERVHALRLLEMQRHALLMYTSCGWFFDELSGIETVQIIQYAARAIQLAGVFDENLEPGFLEILGRAESNLPDPHDGRQIYERFVKPAIMTRESVAAHYAISSLFQTYPEEARIYSFTIRQEDRQLFTVGKTRLAAGRIKIIFEITRSTDTLTYAVFHSGDHTINCAVREDGDTEGYKKMVQELRAPFEHGDFAEMIRVMDRHFGPAHYSVEHLFHDEQRVILDRILASPRDEIYNTLRHITEHYAPLRRFMADLHTPPLKALGMATEIVVNTELRRQFEGDALDLERVRNLLAESAASKVTLYSEGLAYALKAHFDRLSDRFVTEFLDMDCLQHFVDAAELTRITPFQINLWKPQNTYYDILMKDMSEIRRCADAGNEQAKAWVEKFLTLGEKLGFAGEVKSK